MHHFIETEDPLEIVVEELDELLVYSAGCASSWSSVGSRLLAFGHPVQFNGDDSTDDAAGRPQNTRNSS